MSVGAPSGGAAAYHSIQNDAKGTNICGTVILALKTKVKGPAPPAKPDQKDIVDEAIEYFRANVLYRTFHPQGPADLQIAYLTAFIGEVLRVFTKEKKKEGGKKVITAVSMSQTFSVPGDKKFPFAGFFKPPENRAEADQFRNYFRQLRETLCDRLLDVVYDKNGDANKWWMQFSKRKFMNIADCA